jgi:hypothetical protein
MFATIVRDVLSNGTTVTMIAAVALVSLEVKLRRSGFARPDVVNLDLEDR